jgi:hypothetical protein
MNKTIGVGVLSGGLGGLVLDAVMRVLPVHAPDGRAISMIGYVGTAIHPSDPWIGWLAYILYGAVIGGIFGYLLGDRALGERTGAFWGGLYGIGWWVIACAILVPALVGKLPFTESARAAVRQVALPLLAGHVVYGGVLGAAFSWITRTLRGARWHHVSHATPHSAPR